MTEVVALTLLRELHDAVDYDAEGMYFARQVGEKVRAFLYPLSPPRESGK